jgi:anti-sigma factor RsiW
MRSEGVRSSTLVSCKSVRGDLPRYIDRELPAGRRSQVAAHLDGCDACYRAYLAERDSMRQLGESLPAVGARHSGQVSHLWAGVQAGILRRRVTNPLREPAKLWLVGILMAAALLLPWLSDQRELRMSLPDPPTPAVNLERALETEAVPELAGTPAAENVHPGDPAQAVSLNVTPPAHPNYAPVSAGATSAP